MKLHLKRNVDGRGGTGESCCGDVIPSQKTAVLYWSAMKILKDANRVQSHELKKWHKAGESKPSFTLHVTFNYLGMKQILLHKNVKTKILSTVNLHLVYILVWMQCVFITLWWYNAVGFSQQATCMNLRQYWIISSYELEATRLLEQLVLSSSKTNLWFLPYKDTLLVYASFHYIYPVSVAVGEHLMAKL